MDKSLFPRLAAAAAVIGFSVMPASAQAQTMAGSPADAVRKTAAILGGPSALAVIIAQQNGGRVPQPASAPLSPALARTAAFSLPVRSTILEPAVATADAPVASDRPDVFGSVALAIGRSPLDARWRRVEHGGVSGQAAAFAAGLRALPVAVRLAAANRYVNRHVHFEDDMKHWGQADVWSSAESTLRSGLGDCEDYAIAKRALLRAAGIPDRDLYLVIVKDLVRRSDHAVLVARADGRLWLLDNGTEAVTDARAMQDYRPVLSFTGAREWTHGYRVTPPMTVAAAPVAAPPVQTASLGGGGRAFGGGGLR